MVKRFTILYSADLHGNRIQYEKFFREATTEKVDAIILGGDLTPKNPEDRTPLLQKKFIKEQLFKHIKDFKNKNPKTKIFLMLGNDDFISNEKYLIKNEKKLGFKTINDKRIKLIDDYDIIGYSYVPVTPFKYKDWEKADCNNILESEYRTGYTTEGLSNVGNNLVKKELDLKNRKDTIEKDLNRLFDKKHSNKTKIILVAHSPPYNTSLDMISSKEHVGSLAIRRIIEQKKPLLSLHGHIHETVRMSGKYLDKISSSVIISPGNDNLSGNIAVIKIDIYKPSNATRKII